MKFLILSLSLLFTQSVFAKTIELGTANTVVFRETVSPDSVFRMQLQLLELISARGDKDYPIYLVMDCPGGDVYYGEQFIQTVKMFKNVETVTIYAASMCSAIVNGLPGKRHVTENGLMMFHRASGRFEGTFETGDVETQLKLWKDIILQIEDRTAKRISISLEDFKSKIVNEWYVYGKNNLTQKTADTVVDLVCTDKLVKKKEKILVEGIFGMEQLTVSGCPLLR